MPPQPRIRSAVRAAILEAGEQGLTGDALARRIYGLDGAAERIAIRRAVHQVRCHEVDLEIESLRTVIYRARRLPRWP